jgi:hypothetical protein
MKRCVDVIQSVFYPTGKNNRSVSKIIVQTGNLPRPRQCFAMIRCKKGTGIDDSANTRRNAERAQPGLLLTGNGMKRRFCSRDSL